MASHPSTEEWITEAVGRAIESMIHARRHLHRYPDLSGSEHGTAAFLHDELRQLGMAPEFVLDGTGVMAELTGTATPSGQHRRLLVRADIDALPIIEADDGREYRSQHDGLMHACGHDAHTAIALGVARVLSEHPEELEGSVLFVFQPDEERITGAAAMIASGVFDDINIDAVLGLHTLSQLEVGTVGVRTGALFASADHFTIEIIGMAGHSGLPHRALDPVPVAAALVLQSQTLVTRECSPLDAAVVSFGSIHGGNAANGIADSVLLGGTVRTFDEDLRSRLLLRTEQMTLGIAHAAGLQARFVHNSGTPAVISDPAMADLVRRATHASPGVTLADIGPLTVGDDMAEFLALAPGCYFMLGAGNATRGITAPHHHPDFDLDEGCLAVGAEVLIRATLDFLRAAPVAGDRQNQPTIERRIDGR